MKEEKIKLRTYIFRTVVIVSFAIFLTLFFGNKYGYYDYKNYEKVSLTQDQIKKFEQDVRDGKQIDLEEYLVNTNKNYHTKLSKAGLNISNGVSRFIKKGVEGFFDSVSKMVTENSE